MIELKSSGGRRVFPFLAPSDLELRVRAWKKTPLRQGRIIIVRLRGNFKFPDERGGVRTFRPSA
jgi:hypothetical protein